MSDITTFAQLTAMPATEKRVTAEILVGESLTAFTQEASPNDAAYAATGGFLPYKDVPLVSGAVSRIPRIVVELWDAGVRLTKAADYASMVATASTWWQDVSGGALYVHPATGAPSTTVARFTLFVSDKPVTLTDSARGITDQYFEPIILSVPSVVQALTDLLSGVAQAGGGEIVLANGDGFFDRLLDELIWTNGPVQLYVGGESLPYTEYQPFFAGFITDKEWGRSDVKLTVKGNQHKLLRKIPEALYDKTTYPNLAQGLEGRPMPIAYGDFRDPATYATDADRSKAEFEDETVDAPLPPSPAVVNTDYSPPGSGGNTILLRLPCPAGGVAEIQYVYFNAHDGSLGSYYNNGWYLCTEYATPPGSLFPNQWWAVDLSKGLFGLTFASGSVFVDGQMEFRVRYRTAEDSAGKTIEFGADIIKDLLTATGDPWLMNINAASFDYSAANVTEPLVVYVGAETQLRDVIDLVCRSEGGRLFQSHNGSLVYRLSTSPMFGAFLNESDFIGDPSVVFRRQELIDEAECLYPSLNYDTPLPESAKNSPNLFAVKLKKQISTAFRKSSGAAARAAAYLAEFSSLKATLAGTASWLLAAFDVGDVICVSLPRAPEKSNGEYQTSPKNFTLTYLNKSAASNTVAFRAREGGVFGGFGYDFGNNFGGLT